MRGFRVAERRYSGTMNNQNGPRGLIAEPVALAAAPARPAQPPATPCGMLSGLPHLFGQNIEGHFNVFQSPVPSQGRNYKFCAAQGTSYEFGCFPSVTPTSEENHFNCCAEVVICRLLLSQVPRSRAAVLRPLG